jgi:hemolysin III
MTPTPVAVARVQSPGEEIANTVSHGLGAAVGAVGLVVMVVAAAVEGDPFKIVGGAVHGASAVLLFLASTVYHAVRRPRAKEILRIVDHVAIHGLIAGTYTPFALVTLRGPWGWSVLGTVWGLALFGMLFEALFLDRFPKLSTGLYLATGWVGVFALGPLLAALPAPAFAWLVAGGLSYTIGVVFFALDRRYHHLVWHLFVIAGAACHLVCVARYVM